MNRRHFITGIAALLATPSFAAVAEDSENFDSRWRRRILRDDTALRVMPADTKVDEKKINDEIERHKKRQQYYRRRHYSHWRRHRA